jgi:hypothetical protein
MIAGLYLINYNLRSCDPSLLPLFHQILMYGLGGVSTCTHGQDREG